MGIQEVASEIIKAADEEARRTEQSAHEEAERMAKEARAEAARLRDSAERSLKAELDQFERKELSSAELESRHAILQLKNDLMSKAFANAEKSISAWDGQKRKAHISLMLDSARRSFSVGKVFSSPSDTGISGGAPAGIMGGVIAENADGTERIDLSYDALLKELREKRMKEVAEILFREK